MTTSSPEAASAAAPGRGARLQSLRERVLRPASPWAAPDHAFVEAAGPSGVPRSLPDLARRLAAPAERHGVGVVDLGSPLPPAQLEVLGRELGDLVAEHDPAVQPFCEGRFVLNLRDAGAPEVVELQPFSSAELLLHTEASLRPEPERPRWIVLQCVCADDGAGGAQTVVVPMASAVQQLSADDLDVLRTTRLVGREHPVLVDPGPVVALRDPAVTGDLFVSAVHSPERVQAAVDRLLEAVYGAEAVRGVSWRPGRLAVIDNRRAFHGRTWTAGTARHLQRVRVASRR